MNMTPLLHAGLAVQLHVAAAAVAIMLSAAILAVPKGTKVHRSFGRAWVAMLAIICASSFWITGINGASYSWIHLLSAGTLLALVQAVWAIRTGKVQVHKNAMLAIMAGALGGAGFFTLVPGRMMNTVLFG